MKHNLITLSLIMSLSACNPFGTDDDDQEIIQDTDAIEHAATFRGDLTGAVTTENGDATGALVITDHNGDDQEVFDTTATGTGSYGTFTINAAGNWTYDLDESLTEVSALESDEDLLIDTITVTSADGTEATVSITINGVTPPNACESSDSTDDYLTFDGAVATHFDTGKEAVNVIDGDTGTVWAGNAADANGALLSVKLSDIATIGTLQFSWNNSHVRSFEYTVETSQDNENWTIAKVTTDSALTDANGDFETIIFETAVVAQYIRITGNGHEYLVADGSKAVGATSTWNTLNELKVTGCSTDTASLDLNTPATFAGDVSGSVDAAADADTAAKSATGTLTVYDIDGDTTEAQTDVTSTSGYGTFTVTADGVWTYTLSASTTLAEGADDLTDTFTVSLAGDDDDATQVVTITIEAPEAAVVGGGDDDVTEDFESYTAGTKIAGDWSTNNLDPSTANVTDAKASGGTQSLHLADLDEGVSLDNKDAPDYYKGSKPFALFPLNDDAALASGTVSFDVLTPDSSSKVSYITIGTGKNNGDRYFQLRINNDDFEYERDTTDGDVDMIDADSWTKDEWHSVSISWTDDHKVSVTLDGEEVATDVDATALNLDETNVPTHVIFSTGDDGSAIGQMYIDNVNIGEADAGGETGGGDTPNAQALAITDTKGKSGEGKDTGELRLKLADVSIDPLVTGRLEVSFKKVGDASNNDPDDVAGGDTGVKEGYIGIYGASANSGYDLVELRVQGHLDDGTLQIRNQDDVDVETTYTQDDWVDVVITWDATNATGETGPLITMTIDGTPVNNGTAFATQDSGKTFKNEADETVKAFADIMNGAQHIVFKHGDNDAAMASAFYIDDMKVYSDTAGTTLVYSEDFEADSFAIDTELTSDNSDYTSNTNEATVKARP